MYSAGDVDILYAQCRPIVKRVIMRSISHRQLTIRYNSLLVIVRCQPVCVISAERYHVYSVCMARRWNALSVRVAEELLR